MKTIGHGLEKLGRALVLLFMSSILAASASMAAEGSAFVAITSQQRSALEVEVTPLSSARTVPSRAHPTRVVVPNDQVRIVAAGLSGLIETLLVAVGDEVVAGQPLAHIRSPELISTQRELRQAVARLDLARATSQRDTQLVEEGIVPGRRALESETAVAEKRARVEELRRSLQLVGMTPEEITGLEAGEMLQPVLIIRAPIDAVVLEQMAEAGRRVEVATPLYRLGQLEPLLLELHVPLELAERVSLGDRVRIPDRGISGRVIAVGRSVHSVDQGVLVRAEVRDGADRLLPGQFVRAQILLPNDSATDERFVIPRSALVRVGPGAYVFVEVEGGFHATPVILIDEGAGEAVVAFEAEPGVRVASRGTAALKALWLAKQGGD